MIRIILTLLIICHGNNLIGQVPKAAIELYNKGLEYYNQKDYVEANSFFSKAIEIYSWPDAYYNKASANYKLNDIKSYCINIKHAADLGDEESQIAYKKKCISIDTIYRNIDSLVSSKEQAAFYEVITVEPHLNQMRYEQYVNDTVIVGYQINKSDTIYSCHPDMDLPDFPGGESGLVKFLSDNIRYPAYSRENGITGTVFVTFVIDKNGKVTGARILRGISIDANNEILRVVNKMPNWKPGVCNGNSVNFQFNLPVKFSLR
ncbi:MAG TPA: TonB family protein [Bacteroidia bacterium]|nr:TonB family protein [Bacteroidia bacterium]